MIGTPPISENGIHKPKTAAEEDVIGNIGNIGGSGPTTAKKNGGLSPEQVERYKRLVREGMMPALAAAAVRGEKVEL